jgi:hypothetical protein
VAAPFGRQSLVGRENELETQPWPEKVADGGNVGFRVISLRWGPAALVRPKAFPDLEGTRGVNLAVEVCKWGEEIVRSGSRGRPVRQWILDILLRLVRS